MNVEYSESILNKSAAVRVGAGFGGGIWGGPGPRPVAVAISVVMDQLTMECHDDVLRLFDRVMQAMEIHSHFEWTNDEFFRQYRRRDSARTNLRPGMADAAYNANGPILKIPGRLEIVGWDSWNDAFEALERCRRNLGIAPKTMTTAVFVPWDEYAALRRSVYPRLLPAQTGLACPVQLIVDPFGDGNRSSDVIWAPLLYWAPKRRKDWGMDEHSILCAALLDRPHTIELEFVSDDEPPDVLSKFVKKHTGLELRHFSVEEIIARGL